jgi:Gpi18-like mannosyltransferase
MKLGIKDTYCTETKHKKLQKVPWSAIIIATIKYVTQNVKEFQHPGLHANVKKSNLKKYTPLYSHGSFIIKNILSHFGIRLPHTTKILKLLERYYEACPTFTEEFSDFCPISGSQTLQWTCEVL